MKKIFALMLILTVASASAAFAAATTVAASTGAVAVGTTTVNTSKNVYVAYKSDTNNSGYAVVTYHDKGTKTYGSSSGDSKVYEKANTGNGCPDAPVGTASADFSSWTSL